MAYNYGNLAVSPKRQEREEYVIREKKTKVVRQKPIPVKEKISYLFVILLGVAICSLIIFRHAEIYKINLQAKQVNSEIQSMTIEVEQLQREVQTLNSPERIRKFAEAQGMVSSLDSGIVVKKTAATN